MTEARAAGAHGVGDGLDGVVLPDDPPAQQVLEAEQPVALDRAQLGDGDAVRRATISATSSAVICGFVDSDGASASRSSSRVSALARS